MATNHTEQLTELNSARISPIVKLAKLSVEINVLLVEIRWSIGFRNARLLHFLARYEQMATQLIQYLLCCLVSVQTDRPTW